MKKIPYLEAKLIQSKADDLRIKTVGDKIPVDVELIAEKHGLDLIPNSQLRTIGIDAWLTNSLDEILYDDTVSDFRLRFSIAHELGHLILHAEGIQELKPPSISEWKQFVKDIPSDVAWRAEHQSNLFAAFLLIPRALLPGEIEKFREELHQIPPDIAVDREMVNDVLARPLARRFLVSEDTMKFYLKNNNINPMDYI